MLKTDRPASPPFVCAVTGRASFGEGFIDLGTVAGIDPQVYIAMDAARDVGRLAGMVSGEERDQLLAELEAAQEQLDALNGQAEEFEDFKRSVEFTFKGIEKLRRPPGPAPVRRAS
jgi:hypothetical protein